MRADITASTCQVLAQPLREESICSLDAASWLTGVVPAGYVITAHIKLKKPGTAFTHGCFRLKERIHLFCLDFTRTHVCRFFSLQIMDKIRLISFLHSVAESCTRPGLRGVGICNLEPLVFHNLSLMCIDLLSRRPGFDLFSEVWSTSVAALAPPSLPFSPSFNPVIYTRPLQSTGAY